MQNTGAPAKYARNVEEYLRNVSEKQDQNQEEQEYPMAAAYASMWKKERLNQRDKSAESLERPMKSVTPLRNMTNFSC